MPAVAQESKFGKVFWPILAWVVALIFFFPIFWMIFTSFKTDADAVITGALPLTRSLPQHLQQHWRWL